MAAEPSCLLLALDGASGDQPKRRSGVSLHLQAPVPFSNGQPVGKLKRSSQR